MAEIKSIETAAQPSLADAFAKVKDSLLDGVTPEQAAAKAREALAKLSETDRKSAAKKVDALMQAGIFQRDADEEDVVLPAAKATLKDLKADKPSAEKAKEGEKKADKASDKPAETPESKIEAAKAETFGKAFNLSKEDLASLDTGLAAVVIVKHQENLSKKEGWISKKAWGLMGYKTEETISDRELESLNTALDAVRGEKASAANDFKGTEAKFDLLRKFADLSAAQRQESLRLKAKGEKIQLAHERLEKAENELRGSRAGAELAKEIRADKGIEDSKSDRPNWQDLTEYFTDDAPITVKDLRDAEKKANVANLSAVVDEHFAAIQAEFGVRGLAMNPAFWDSVDYHSNGSFDNEELKVVNSIAAAAVVNPKFKDRLSKYGANKSDSIETVEKPADVAGRELFRKLGVETTDRVKPENVRLTDKAAAGKNNAVNAVYEYVLDQGNWATSNMDFTAWENDYRYDSDGVFGKDELATLNAMVAAVVHKDEKTGEMVRDEKRFAALAALYTGQLKLDQDATRFADNNDGKPTGKALERKEMDANGKGAYALFREVRDNKEFGKKEAAAVLVELGFTEKAAKNVEQRDLTLTLNLLATGALLRDTEAVTKAQAELAEAQKSGDKAAVARADKRLKAAENAGLSDRDLVNFGYPSASLGETSVTRGKMREAGRNGTAELINGIRDNALENGIDAKEFARRLANLRLYLASPEAKGMFEEISGKDAEKGRGATWEMSRFDRNGQLAETKTHGTDEEYFRLLAEQDLSGTTDEVGGAFGEEQLGAKLEQHELTDAQKGYVLLILATYGGFDFKKGGPEKGAAMMAPTYLEDVDSVAKAQKLVKDYPALLPFVRQGFKKLGAGWEAVVTSPATFSKMEQFAAHDPKIAAEKAAAEKAKAEKAAADKAKADADKAAADKAKADADKAKADADKAAADKAKADAEKGAKDGESKAAETKRLAEAAKEALASLEEAKKAAQEVKDKAAETYALGLGRSRENPARPFSLPNDTIKQADDKAGAALKAAQEAEKRFQAAKAKFEAVAAQFDTPAKTEFGVTTAAVRGEFPFPHNRAASEKVLADLAAGVTADLGSATADLADWRANRPKPEAKKIDVAYQESQFTAQSGLMRNNLDMALRGVDLPGWSVKFGPAAKQEAEMTSRNLIVAKAAEEFQKLHDAFLKGEIDRDALQAYGASVVTDVTDRLGKSPDEDKVNEVAGTLKGFAEFKAERAEIVRKRADLIARNRAAAAVPLTFDSVEWTAKQLLTISLGSDAFGNAVKPLQELYAADKAAFETAAQEALAAKTGINKKFGKMDAEDLAAVRAQIVDKLAQ